MKLSRRLARSFLGRIPWILFLGSIALRAVTVAAEPENALRTDACPVELGRVPWLRDFDTAVRQARETGKPLLILFQEVPGCSTCKDFGKGPLSHPLVVDAAGQFVPICVYNSVRDKTGQDAHLLTRFGEAAWSNPVVRFTDAEGKDLVPKVHSEWSLAALLRRMMAALQAAGRPLPPWLELVQREYAAEQRERAVFAMSCYWSGERSFGEMHGVVKTQIGILEHREVVEVQFDPSRISYAVLAAKAKEHRCADAAMARTEEQSETARGIFGGQAVVRTDKPVDTSTQQKYHLFHRPAYYYLPLTDLQATRINSAIAARQDPDRWLSPSQIKLKQRLAAIITADDPRNVPKELKILVPDRSAQGLAKYVADLEALLAARDEVKP